MNKIKLTLEYLVVEEGFLLKLVVFLVPFFLTANGVLGKIIKRRSLIERPSALHPRLQLFGKSLCTSFVVYCSVLIDDLNKSTHDTHLNLIQNLKHLYFNQ